MLRLTALICLLLHAAAQDSADPVRALIEKLGSDDIEVREGAAKELTRIGFSTLPVLKEAAAKSTGDSKRLLDRIIERVTMMGAPVLVTMEAKDRPLKDIVADLERQTLIPFRLIGAAADAKSSVSAKETVVWKVVEDICRVRGDLMYRFKDDVIEIYPSPFRSLQSVDLHGMRFFIDRFIWDHNHVLRGHFRQHGSLLTPRGARVVWVGVKVDEVTDNLGNNLAKIPEGHRMYIGPDGWQSWPNSRRIVHPFGFHWLNQPPPAPEATRITRCRGTVEVLLAEEVRRLASVPDPLGRPSTSAREELPSLGITSWKIYDGWLRMRIATSWDEPSERILSHRLMPFLILRRKDGDWEAPTHWNERSRLSPNEVQRIDTMISFKWPEGCSAVSLDLIAPHPTVRVEIPFDFRDIALR